MIVFRIRHRSRLTDIPSIHPVEVASFQDGFVTFNERTQPQFSHQVSYFETWEEAKRALIRRATIREYKARATYLRARAFRETAEGIRPEDPKL